jgi:hypothetical protein
LTINTLFHLIFFQVCWALSIICHDSLLSWLVVGLIPIYLLIEHRFEKTKFSELLLRAAIIVAGLMAELLFRHVGLTNYSSPEFIVPSWLFLVWLSFGLTFNGCYRWLNNYSIWISISLGAVFGPMTYWIASQIAPFEILQPIGFTLASSVFWGLLYAVSVTFSHAIKN